jgi:BirA family biotin operon repressor/biotin-[acetyl-CoA-carboxylase] ligase
MGGNRLNAESLKRSCQKPWSDIVVFESIGSTSDWVKAQEHPHLVCLADRQTAGRGRHGQQWQSSSAENIYLSYSWLFDKTPKHLGLLSLWVGIVLAEVLEKQGVRGHGVKWPNDLYWQQQKMGGILIEASNLSSQLVVGIGLNVNMNEGNGIDQPWTSVGEAMQKPVDRDQLIVALLDALHIAMVEFPHVDMAEFMRRWNRWDIIRGQHVSFSEGENTLSGESRGIDQNGHLKVLLDSGELRAFGTSISKVRW